MLALESVMAIRQTNLPYNVIQGEKKPLNVKKFWDCPWTGWGSKGCLCFFFCFLMGGRGAFLTGKKNTHKKKSPENFGRILGVSCLCVLFFGFFFALPNYPFYCRKNRGSKLWRGSRKILCSERKYFSEDCSEYGRYLLNFVLL